MGKIVCDICGTSYPDTADQCPICGCSKDASAQLLDDELLAEEKEEKTVKSSLFSGKKRKEIFDFDEVNNGAADDEESEEPVDQYDEDEEEEEEEEERPNTFLVILLTILIVILLLAAGILFIRFIRPNMDNNGQDTPTIPTTESIAEPLFVGIPCETLVLSSGNEVSLNSEGGMFLLHVNKIPSDSTDEIVYTSADERVATVTSDGRIEAVSEGQTTITITCGDKSITATVVVDYTVATEPATEPATVPTAPAQTPAAPTVQNPVANNTYRTDVVLKLKQSDFILPIGTYHTLLLDCDLDPSDVEWSTEHSYVATVDETGKVTAVGFGVTDVIVKYGDQEAHCKVRCGY